jgi:DNA primase
VAALAQDVGLPVPESGEPERPRPPPALWDALEQAAQFYKKQLKQTSHAIDYLKRRGLTGVIAARYGIGYAPNGWSPLKQVFRRLRGGCTDRIGTGDRRRAIDATTASATASCSRSRT